jgi:hypothetical protein
MINYRSQDHQMGKSQSPSPSHHTDAPRLGLWLGRLCCGIALVSGGWWLRDQITAPAPPLTQSPNLPLGLNQPQPVPTNPAVTLPSQFSTAKPVPMGCRIIAGDRICITMIDLTDPEVFLDVGLAHNAKQANSSKATQGDEQFTRMVRRHRAAVTVNGTFFSMDQQKRVMGNLVSGGRFLKFSPWENYGTTLGLRTGNRPEMTTARVDGKPQWNQHWFSITAGPRLMRQGKIKIQPQAEGFSDRSMIEGAALRVAIGYPKSGRSLMLVTFLTPVTLHKEAKIMAALGNHEAMNLDGGTSVGLAKGNKILKPAGRELTNVITIYDQQYPAPKSLRDSWRTFQRGGAVVAQQR